MRAAENDFEGYSDDNSTGKGRDGAGRRRGRFCEGAGCMQDVARLLFVRVHIGRGQDPCISERAVRRRNQSHPLARDDGAVNNDGHKRRNETGFITVEKTLKGPLQDHTRCNAALCTLVLCDRSGAHSALSAQ